MDFQAEYRSKLRTPAEAVRAVKNGDWGFEVRSPSSGIS